MKDKHALIIDTGCANINSLKFALNRVGFKALVSDDPAQICSANKVFLPGVGAAAYAMDNIANKQLIDTIQGLQQPVLGICLGMQLLSQTSHENNINTPCLGLIDAQVVPLQVVPLKPQTTKPVRLPHMGWNTLYDITDSPLFHDITKQDYFYFVHSYGIPVGHATIASCHYGQAFSASVQQDNFFGVQFHPERSGNSGAKLLTNFMENC
ncbi:imidazole glycerol phosphate synthase subunit HisH [Thalassotalea maritima]|uniref:imidazole glycerol phosphate synthase subunit HisH n=1 Tax=Thalassotalea maritima TaxID=3242416 RepID=UPI003528FE41